MRIAARPPADRHHLAPRVQGQAAAVVDDVVPHPQPALLRLTEVVGVEHAGDIAGEVDGDDPVVRVARSREVRRVDDRGVRLPGRRVVVVIHGVVQLLLHARHVGVGGLHDQPCPGPEARVRPDVAVHDHHVALGDVGVLLRRDAVEFRPGHRLLGGIGRVFDDVGRPCAAGVHLRLHRDIAKLSDHRVWHFLRQLAKTIRGRIPLHLCRFYLVRHVLLLLGAPLHAPCPGLRSAAHSHVRPALRDLGSVPRHDPVNCRWPGAYAPPLRGMIGARSPGRGRPRPASTARSLGRRAKTMSGEVRESPHLAGTRRCRRRFPWPLV